MTQPIYCHPRLRLKFPAWGLKPPFWRVKDLARELWNFWFVNSYFSSVGVPFYFQLD